MTKEENMGDFSADEEPAPGLFDWPLYGLMVRKRRTDLGFTKAEDFSKSIWRRTRVSISRDSLYKIEQGRQIPNGHQFLALNIALYGELLPGRLLDICLSENWKKILGHNGEVPIEWKMENYDEGIKELGLKDGTDPTLVAIKLKDEPSLFANFPF